MPSGMCGLFKNTQGARKHQEYERMVTEIVKDFAHFLTSKYGGGNTLVNTDDIPNIVQEYINENI